MSTPGGDKRDSLFVIGYSVQVNFLLSSINDLVDTKSPSVHQRQSAAAINWGLIVIEDDEYFSDQSLLSRFTLVL